ncbi:AAA family ATPase [Micromonospora chalcea]|uniref:AAA family ATPase n=1 Tax=Micromonospora chalcea TaxID=1874 RepID=UPI003CEBFDE0
MTWLTVYRGDGKAREATIPPAPPWREFPRRPLSEIFQPPAGLVDAVNAAVCLRRPLLITGAPGSGKSAIVESVAAELGLGRVLRWHITSRSTLTDALYRYDALGRIHAQQLAATAGAQPVEDIGSFLQLGPLGTALLPSKRPRPLLIDEIDKSDLDLPSDLLDVLERGEFEIPELARHDRAEVGVREWDSDVRRTVVRGRIQCTEFPFIVMTSNGERGFPGPFLRRCIRFAMPQPTVEMLSRVVQAHIAARPDADATHLIQSFVDRVRSGESLAVDQLLNAIYLLTGDDAPKGTTRDQLRELLLRELSGV